MWPLVFEWLHVGHEGWPVGALVSAIGLVYSLLVPPPTGRPLAAMDKTRRHVVVFGLLILLGLVPGRAVKDLVPCRD